MKDLANSKIFVEKLVVDFCREICCDSRVSSRTVLMKFQNVLYNAYIIWTYKFSTYSNTFVSQCV